MSNNMNAQEAYEWITNIDSLEFSGRSALIIGGRDLGKQYVLALSRMNVKDITVITKTGHDTIEFCKQLGIRCLTGGFEKHLPNMKEVDLVIIATPIHTLFAATKLAIKSGQKNILVEKPGSLYHSELTSLDNKINFQKIRIAYNRLMYPNFHKLKLLVEKEGGITSCRFTFTEWLSRIDFKKDVPEVYKLWGISNSLHVISMVTELIGMPKEIHSYQYGKLEWHESGSIFLGCGISENNIPFSYHADWGSGGRWGIEIMTKKSSYKLVPLEQLYVCPKDSGKWEPVPFEMAYPDVKPGIAEEIAVMLDDLTEKKIGLISLEKAVELNKLAEKIFGYKKQ